MREDVHTAGAAPARSIYRHIARESSLSRIGENSINKYTAQYFIRSVARYAIPTSPRGSLV